MRIRLFSADSNPKIDQPLCHKSVSYVEQLIVSGQAELIDGKTAKLLPTQEQRQDQRNHISGSGFDSAWGIRQSGEYGPLTWQLNT